MENEQTQLVHTSTQHTQQAHVQGRELQPQQQNKKKTSTHPRPGTPIRGARNQNGQQRESVGSVRTPYPSAYDYSYQVPVENRFEPLWDQNRGYGYSSPRPFLGRGQGGQRRGRGFPPYRSRPPTQHYPPMTSTYRENQWKDPYHWERHQLQQQNSRKNESGVAEQDLGSKKRRESD